MNENGKEVVDVSGHENVGGNVGEVEDVGEVGDVNDGEGDGGGDEGDDPQLYLHPYCQNSSATRSIFINIWSMKQASERISNHRFNDVVVRDKR